MSAAASILDYKGVWENDVWECVWEYDDDNWKEESIDNFPLIDDRYDQNGNTMPELGLEILYAPDQKLIDEILLCGKIAITASTVLRPLDSFDTQLCINRADTMSNFKKGTFIHDIAVVVGFAIVKEKLSITNKKILIPPLPITPEYICTLVSELATYFKLNYMVPQRICK